MPLHSVDPDTGPEESDQQLKITFRRHRRQISSGSSPLILSRLTKIVLITFLLYSLIGFFVLPSLITSLAQFALPAGTDYRLAISSASLNPFSFELGLNDLTLGNTADERSERKTLLVIDRLVLDLQLVSLWKKALFCRKVNLRGMELLLTGNEQPAQIIGALTTALSGFSPGSFSYQLQNISVEKSRVVFDDPARGIYHQAEEIFLTLPLLSNLKTSVKDRAKLVPPGFSAVIDGEPVVFSGETLAEKDQTVSSRLDLEFTDLDLAYLSTFLPVLSGSTAISGKLDLTVELFLAADPDSAQPVLVTGRARIKDLLTESRTMNSLVSSAVSDFKLDPFSGRFTSDRARFSEIRISGPDGLMLNLEELTADKTSFSRRESTLVVDLLTGDARSISIPAMVLDGLLSPTGVPLLKFTFKKLDISGETAILHHSDEAEPLMLSDFGLALNNLSPDGPGIIRFTSKLGNNGFLELDGTLHLFPLSADLYYRTAGLPLKSAKSILSPFIQPYLHSALVESEGSVTVPGLEIRGSASISDLTATISPERTFFKCQKVELKDFHLLNNPPSLKIKALIFESPVFSVQLSDRKRPALGGFLFPATVTGDGDKSVQVEAEDVRLQNGFITVKNYSAIPMADIRISGLEGKSSGMVNKAGAMMPFTLRGKVRMVPDPTYFNISGKTSPANFKLKGETSLFGDNPLLIANFQGKGFDLVYLAPYLSSAIGNEPKRGRFDLSSSITMKNHHLSTTNRLVVSRLKLGRINTGRYNPQLAVALLTDKKGEIDLDLEVKGRIGEAGFSYPEALAEQLRQILVKATSSPLRLIPKTASLPDSLELISFVPATDRLGHKQLEQLEALAHIMASRPLLAVTIKGQADPFSENAAFFPGGPTALAKARGRKVHELLLANGVAADQVILDQTSEVIDEEIITDLPANRADITLVPKESL